MPWNFEDPSAGSQQAQANAGTDNAGSSQLLDSESVSAFNKQAHQIKESAQNGGWAISEEGMKQYQKVCDTFLDRYTELRPELWQLSEQVRLGSSPYAYAVAEFNVMVAKGDERSLIPNLELMKDAYETLKEALETAKQNYNENEQSVSQAIRKTAQQ